jgi:glycosidase
VIAYMRGVPFIYNGTEVAFPTPIVFPFTSVTIDWTQNPDVTAQYTRVIGLRNNSTAIRRGALISYDNNDICAFTKTAPGDTVFAVVNLRNSSITYPIPAALQNTSWYDGFDGSAQSPGTQLTLPAYGYQVFRKQ